MLFLSDSDSLLDPAEDDKLFLRYRFTTGLLGLGDLELSDLDLDLDLLDLDLLLEDLDLDLDREEEYDLDLERLVLLTDF